MIKIYRGLLQKIETADFSFVVMPEDGIVPMGKLVQLIRRESPFSLAFSWRSIKLRSYGQRFQSLLISVDEFQSL